MNAPTLLDPKVLGFWIRCIRESKHMSQDALAEACGVDIRTVQRAEAGNRMSITTRRCLARGLGYDNADTFDDPQFAKNVHELLAELRAVDGRDVQKQHPDHVRIKAERVLNGDALGRFADTSNVVALSSDDEISQDAKKTAAAMFDYIRDLVDIRSDVSFTDKVAFNQDLETTLRELHELGAAVYSASRSLRLTSDTWVDKTPMHRPRCTGRSDI